jgi:protein-disulfide isomerase
LLIFSAPQVCSETGPDEIIAVLNGTPVYRAEIEQNVAFKLYRMRAGIFSLLKRETEEFVERKLLAGEAARRGLSVEQLLQQEVHAEVQPPDEVSVENYLAAHPKENSDELQRRERVRTYLYQSALAQRKIDFMASLKSKAEFNFLLQPPAKPRTRIQIQGQPWQGDPDAPVVMVDFTDLTSKICVQNDRNIRKAMTQYPGKIKWVHRNYFGPFDQNALFVAQLGEWAHEQGKFWEFHAAVSALNGDVEAADILQVAKDLGLDTGEYHRGENERLMLQRVKEDISAAKRSGVTGVPVIFVNGLYFSGTFPYDQLKGLIEEELTRTAKN